MHLLSILCCFIPQIILAQQAELVLKGVEETRSIHYMEKNKLELITELTGIEVDDDHQIRLKEINGVDNLGNQLESIGGYPYPNDYFTKQKLHNIQIDYSYGFTDDDLNEVKKVNGVDIAEGGYSITGFLNRLYFTSFEINFNVKLTSFTVLFVQFCLSTDKSTLVCESFILVT